jgi:hypothetical protein
MKTFICPRCSYETIYITNYRGHLERKTPCEDVNESGCSIEECKANIQEDRSSFKHTCTFCSKRFKTHQSLYQHGFHCQIKRESEATAPSQTNNNTTNNNITNIQGNNNITNNNNITINQNIQIVIKNFGHEDITHVVKDKAFLDKCLQATLPGLVSVIEKIYYDKEKPENKTVMMKSVKRQTLMVREQDDWKVKPMCDVVPKMVIKGKDILSTHLETNRPEYPESDDDFENSSKFSSYLNKQKYFASIDQQKKPEIFTACNAVKALIENHRFE